MRTFIYICISLWIAAPAHGQSSEPVAVDEPAPQLNWEINLGSNQTLIPFIGGPALLSQKNHFLGQAACYRERRWSAGIHAGAYYHQYLQSGIQLFGSMGKQIGLPKSIGQFKPYLMTGLHAKKPVGETIVLDQGEYQVNPSHWNLGLMGGMGMSYRHFFPSHRAYLSLSYQAWFMGPFVKGYIPLLPNSTMLMGIQFPLAKP
jgi:hypothetical protein